MFVCPPFSAPTAMAGSGTNAMAVFLCFHMGRFLVSRNAEGQKETLCPPSCLGARADSLLLSDDNMSGLPFIPAYRVYVAFIHQ